MTIHSLLHPYVIGGFGAAAVAIASASTALLLVLVTVRLLPDAPAATRYRLLLSAVLAFALPLPLLFAGVLYRHLWLNAAATPAVGGPGGSVELGIAEVQRTRTPVDWQCPTVASIAVVGGALFLIVVLRAVYTRRRVLRDAHAAPEPVVRMLHDVAGDARGITTVPIFVTPAVSSPALIGVVHPLIVLPAHAMQALDGDALRAVLAHEAAHLARRDNLASLVTSVIAAIFWFNPLVWLTLRALELERERACDHIALERSTAPQVFIEALLVLCSGTVRDNRPGLSCINSSRITERVDYIMSTDRITPKSRFHAFVSVFATAIAVVLIAAFVTDRPLIAAQADGPYLFDFWSKLPDLAVTVRDAATGDELHRISLRTKPGEKANAVIKAEHSGGLEFEVAVDHTDPSHPVVHAYAKRDGRILQEASSRMTVNTVTSIEPPAGTPESESMRRVSLSLTDVDAATAFIELARLGGRRFQIDGQLTGRVTLNVNDEPWLGVLTQVMSQLHANAREVDGVVHVSAAAEERSPADATARASDSQAALLTADMTAPVILSRVSPKYTDEAKAARIAGMCIVATEIDEEGNVVDATVVKGLPMGLDAAALEAVKQWKFEPAKQDGHPVRVKFNVTVGFRLAEPK